MKTLYLVRHAKSSWSDPSLPDFDRPLNKRGEKDAPGMGLRLKKRNVLPGLIVSSPARRALTTAQIIAREIGYASGEIATDDAIYHADARHLLEILRRQDDRFNAIMLIGHNPGFTDFGNLLAGKYLENIPTCGVLALRFMAGSWKGVKENEGEMLFYDYPKKPEEKKFMS